MRTRFTVGLVAALLLAAIPGSHVQQATAAAHPVMNCDVDASSYGRGSLGTNVNVEISCDFWSLHDHPDLGGSKQQFVIFQGSYASEPFRITLKQKIRIGESHSDLECSGTLLYEPDPSGFSLSDRYYLSLLCREGLMFASVNPVYHPEMYCQPTYAGMQRSSFEMKCWAISASSTSYRRWLWYHPNGTLVASYRGKKNGQVIVRSNDPTVTQVTLRQWGKGDTSTDIVIPIVDGVGIYSAPTRKRRVGMLVVGDYQIDGIGSYYVRSRTIIWGQ